jgi:hypothetical protein
VTSQPLGNSGNCLICGAGIVLALAWFEKMNKKNDKKNRNVDFLKRFDIITSKYIKLILKTLYNIILEK